MDRGRRERERRLSLDPGDDALRLSIAIEARRNGSGQGLITRKTCLGVPFPFYGLLCVPVKRKEEFGKNGEDTIFKVCATIKQVKENFNKVFSGTKFYHWENPFSSKMIEHCYTGVRYGDAFVKKHGEGLYVELSEERDVDNSQLRGARVRVGVNTHRGNMSNVDGLLLRHKVIIPEGTYIRMLDVDVWRKIDGPKLSRVHCFKNFQEITESNRD